MMASPLSPTGGATFTKTLLLRRETIPAPHPDNQPLAPPIATRLPIILLNSQHAPL